MKAALLIPVICVHDFTLLRLLLPISPYVLSPEAHTVPLLSRAMLKYSPAQMEFTPLIPLIVSGAVRCVVVPSPNSPALLLPQPCKVPPVVRARLCCSPVEIAATPLSTRAAPFPCVVVPSP